MKDLHYNKMLDYDFEFSIGNTLFEVLLHRIDHFTRRENNVHNHHAGELIAVLGGTLRLRDGRNEHIASTNEVIYVPKQLDHLSYYESSTHFSICFSIQKQTEMKRRREDTFSLFEKVFDNDIRVVKCNRTDFDFFVNFDKDMKNHATLFYYYVQNQIRMFFILLAERIIEERQLTSKAMKPLGMVNFLIYEEMYYGKNKNLRLSDLAKTSYTSERQVSRIIKRTFGESFGRRKIQLKIESAKEYLEKSEESVESIAAKLSYCDSASFIRAFKREVGITPLQYRKQTRTR